jgi:hypothetical protein
MSERIAWRRPAIVGVTVAALLALATAPSASASVTLGQLGPPFAGGCTSGIDRVQPPVISGNTYVVPGTGTITSWSHNAGAGAGQAMFLKVFRPLGGVTYMAVGRDGRALSPNQVNTFTGVNIPVKPGDILGLNASSGLPGCSFSAPGDRYLRRAGDLPDGASGDFQDADAQSDFRLNVTAVFEPTNTFTLGAVTRNKKKGTATLTATVPNPGELNASGKGVKASSAAVTSKAVGAGVAKLVIRAKGKKKQKLNDTGKVKLNSKITYTPTGGAANTVSRKVKLKKNL